ncbi:hypothetical protein NPIL_405751, partial [Nephila pilipes]
MVIPRSSLPRASLEGLKAFRDTTAEMMRIGNGNIVEKDTMAFV